MLYHGVELIISILLFLALVRNDGNHQELKVHGVCNSSKHARIAVRYKNKDARRPTETKEGRRGGENSYDYFLKK